MSKKIFLSNSTLDFSLKNINTDEKNILDFENSLERYLGENNFAVALNSGTSAIHLALILLGVTNGDEVICQSFTFVASANPILYLGASPIFIDSEKETWNMSPYFLEKAILDRISKGKKPKVIIFVHLYGMPAKIDEILAISKKYNIPLIEDAAEALGSEYKGQKCGTFGDFGIISFNNNKIITTFGGGILVCKNKEYKEKATFLSKQARDVAPHYQHSEIGYNYRISNLSAFIGIDQMQYLVANKNLRRNINSFYKDFFNNIDGIYLFEEYKTDIVSNHWLSCLVLNKEIKQLSVESIRLQLLKDNIESRPLWKPLHLQPLYKDAFFYGEGVSENLFKNGLCLPSGSNLTLVDLGRITASIKKLL